MEQRTALTTIFLMVFAGCAAERSGEAGVKLYAMDCGAIDVSDMSVFSDEGVFDGEAINLVNPCFLVRHPDGDLLWDTGHEEKLAETPGGSRFGPWHYFLETKLTDQLARLGLSVLDIEYLSLSHLHPDHSGNSNLFVKSTFLINRLERTYMFTDENRASFGASYSELEGAETVLFEEDYDVFGDGVAVVKAMPGHTPGSSVLLVRLENSGSVLLTGDLYTHARARDLQTVPVFNVDRQATIDSRRKFEDLAAKEGARVVIQHSKIDFDSLPVFPEYLE